MHYEYGKINPCMRKSSHPIRVAVVGTGTIGMRHLNILRKDPEVDVVAIPSRSERVNQLIKKGIPAVAKLAEVMPCHAVIIATDTNQHVKGICEAIDLGIHVILVEKPLASSLSSLKPIANARDTNDYKIYIGYCLRFDIGLLTFREKLPLIGQVYNVQIEARSYLPNWRPHRNYRQSYSARQGEGGVLLDLIHEIDYAIWLFGMPQTVFGKLGYSGQLDIETEDHVSIFWTAPSGTHISIALDYLSKIPVRRMTAYGVNGVLKWDALACSVEMQVVNIPIDLIKVGGMRDDMYYAQMKAFLKAVAGENSKQLVSFHEGEQSLSVCDAIRRSSETGSEEEVLHWKVP